MDTHIVETKGSKKYNRSGQQVMSCIICGEGTTMTGTEHCDRCHELDTRIRRDLDIAERLVKYYRASAAGRAEFALLASIPFTEESGIRFFNNSGTTEHKGEKITLNNDLGWGVNVTYKGKRYRVAPEDIIGAIIDAVDGTTNGI